MKIWDILVVVVSVWGGWWSMRFALLAVTVCRRVNKHSYKNNATFQRDTYPSVFVIAHTKALIRYPHPASKEWLVK